METRRLVRTDSPGRPPQLSHSSWTMYNFYLSSGNSRDVFGLCSAYIVVYRPHQQALYYVQYFIRGCCKERAYFDKTMSTYNFYKAANLNITIYKPIDRANDLRCWNRLTPSKHRIVTYWTIWFLRTAAKCILKFCTHASGEKQSVIFFQTLTQVVGRHLVYVLERFWVDVM